MATWTLFENGWIANLLGGGDIDGVRAEVPVNWDGDYIISLYLFNDDLTYDTSSSGDATLDDIDASGLVQGGETVPISVTGAASEMTSGQKISIDDNDVTVTFPGVDDTVSYAVMTEGHSDRDDSYLVCVADFTAETASNEDVEVTISNGTLKELSY